MNNFVSIIIPSYNNKNFLKTTLQSLKVLNYPKNFFEVLVAIDGSNDGTKETIKNWIFPFNFKYFYFEKNIGKSTILNKAVGYSKGEIIIFLDSDMIVSQNLVNAHIRCVKKKQISIGLSEISSSIKETPFIKYLKKGEKYLHRIKLLQKENLSFQYCLGGNFAISKEDLLSIGLFDEQLIRFEDIELGYRLVNAGFCLKYNIEAKTQHLLSYTDIYKFYSREKRTAKYAIIFAKKHPQLKKMLKINNKFAILANFVFILFKIISIIEIFGYNKLLQLLYILIEKIGYSKGLKNATKGNDSCC